MQRTLWNRSASKERDHLVGEVVAVVVDEVVGHHVVTRS